MKVRKLLRILHRDFGYFIVGMTIVYALSGIFLNHRHDFNPDYKIYTGEFIVQKGNAADFDEHKIRTIFNELEYDISYKKHYVSNEGFVRVFIENGEAVIDPVKGEGVFRYLEPRPLIFEMNKLHKATLGTVWKWVSDIMAVILLLVAITGIFLLKGKRGFMRWGWWLMISGFIVPLVFALLFI